MNQGGHEDERSRGTRLWPFGPVAAIAATIVIVILLVGGLAVVKAVWNWPDSSTEKWVVPGLLALALAPLLLVVLDRMSSTGGTLEVRGVKIAFAAVVQEQPKVVLPRNMGVPVGLAINDTGGSAVLSALERFAKSDVVIIDLEDGTAWWETRLTVVCAGAARLGRPRAVVFVATEKGVERRFQGWAEPSQLLAAISASDSNLRRALDDADVLARRWRLAFLPPRTTVGDVPDPAPAVPVPFPDATSMGVQWIVFNNNERNPLAPEQILMNRLASLETPTPRGMSIVRLRDLFEGVLHGETIDERDPPEKWLDATVSHEDDYLAVTRDGVYVGLLSHRAFVNHVLAALTQHAEGARNGNRQVR